MRSFQELLGDLRFFRGRVPEVFVNPFGTQLQGLFDLDSVVVVQAGRVLSVAGAEHTIAKCERVEHAEEFGLFGLFGLLEWLVIGVPTGVTSIATSRTVDRIKRPTADDTAFFRAVWLSTSLGSVGLGTLDRFTFGERVDLVFNSAVDVVLTNRAERFRLPNLELEITLGTLGIELYGFVDHVAASGDGGKQLGQLVVVVGENVDDRFGEEFRGVRGTLVGAEEKSGIDASYQRELNEVTYRDLGWCLRFVIFRIGLLIDSLRFVVKVFENHLRTTLCGFALSTCGEEEFFVKPLNRVGGFGSIGFDRPHSVDDFAGRCVCTVDFARSLSVVDPDRTDGLVVVVVHEHFDELSHVSGPVWVSVRGRKIRGLFGIADFTVGRVFLDGVTDNRISGLLRWLGGNRDRRMDYGTGTDRGCRFGLVEHVETVENLLRVSIDIRMKRIVSIVECNLTLLDRITETIAFVHCVPGEGEDYFVL